MCVCFWSAGRASFPLGRLQRDSQRKREINELIHLVLDYDFVQRMAIDRMIIYTFRDVRSLLCTMLFVMLYVNVVEFPNFGKKPSANCLCRNIHVNIEHSVVLFVFSLSQQLSEQCGFFLGAVRAFGRACTGIVHFSCNVYFPVRI